MDLKSFQELRESVRQVLEAKEMHHYTSGIDASRDKSGNFSSSDQKSLHTAGNAAKKAGMKVSYSSSGGNNSRGTTGHSSSLKAHHDLVHISHHDQGAVHKVLQSTGHSSGDEMNDALKSKTHGGHSEATNPYDGAS